MPLVMLTRLQYLLLLDLHPKPPSQVLFVQLFTPARSFLLFIVYIQFLLIRHTAPDARHQKIVTGGPSFPKPNPRLCLPCLPMTSQRASLCSIPVVDPDPTEF